MLGFREMDSIKQLKTNLNEVLAFKLLKTKYDT